MEKSKKKKVMIVSGALLAIGGLTYYFLNRSKPVTTKSASSTAQTSGSLKDKNGNVIEITSMPYKEDPKSGKWVTVNGKMDGQLVSIQMGSDGLVYGTNGYGRMYKYTTKWEQVQSIGALGSTAYLLN